MPRSGCVNAEHQSPGGQPELLLASVTAALDDLDQSHGATGRPGRTDGRDNGNPGCEGHWMLLWDTCDPLPATKSRAY